MIIYPAIDLRGGRCVRLRQGDPNAETVYGEDPAAMARHWAEQGAEWLHVVNLDGALAATRAQLDALHRSSRAPARATVRVAPIGAGPDDPLPDAGLPINLVRLREIRRAVTLPIQFGGGLRTLEDIRLALELGADRVVLGTAAVHDPSLVDDALSLWGAERIVVGIDARDGLVATHGWQETSQLEAIELGHLMAARGVTRVVYTDISRDGMLGGVNLEATARLGDVTGLRVIASGGVGSLADIEQIKRYEHYNIEGVITGQALYTGALDLAQAIEVGRRPLTRHSAGIVPYRRTAQGVELLLLYNLFFEQWQFPRCCVRKDESDAETARRAFREKTGLDLAQVHDEISTTLEYLSVIRETQIERTVVYFLAEAGPGEVRLGYENHCEARWETPQGAWELLTETSPEQLPALDMALAYLNMAR